jgi:glucose-6-phosphate 1-dehydrogenase
MVGEPVELVAPPSSHGERSPYERLIGDASAATRRFSPATTCVEAAWRVVEPILARPPVELYESGTWGPARRRGS